MKCTACCIYLHFNEFHNIYIDLGTTFHYLYCVDPKSIPMKKIYIALLMVSTLVLSAQEPVDLSGPVKDEIAGFKLYPNPVYDGVVYITTQLNARKEIIVYDVFGEVVLKEHILNKRLNISRLVPGVYVLQITENNKSLTRKLVVK